MAHASPPRTVRLAQANRIFPPESTVFPIRAIVAFDHDRFRLLARDDVHVSEKALVRLKGEAFGSAVEPMAVGAESRRLSMRRFVVSVAVPVPGAVGSGPGGKLLVKPDTLGNTRRLTPPARRRGGPIVEHLDFGFRDAAFRLHDHFDVASFPSRHCERLRRAFAHLADPQILWVVQDRLIGNDRRPFDQRDLVLRAPGAAAVDPIAKRLFEAGAETGAIERELPKGGVLLVAD